MTRAQRTPGDGRAVLVAGGTGSGKSLWARQKLGGARRLMVWDSIGEWSRLDPGAYRIVRSVPELAEFVRADLVARAPVSRAAWCGPVTREAFALFCRLAWVWLRIRPGALVVEELSDVTSPGKAPAAWGEIVRKGRHYGAQVYAITQRPAESDKTIVGNAALIHTGMMPFPSDRAYMAQCLDVDVARVTALAPLDYLERDMRTRELRRGRVALPPGAARAR